MAKLEVRGRVRYEGLEEVEEEDGAVSQSLGVFQAGEELEAFRRAFSKDLLDTTTPRSLGSPRPTRLLELLPVAPWCGQCLPQAPDGQLAIKPEEISLGQHSDLRALTENIEEYGILDRSEKRSRDRRACRREEGSVVWHNRSTRLEQLKERLELTAQHPTQFFQRTVDRPEDVQLPPSLPRSRFSREAYAGHDAPMHPASDSESDSEAAVPPLLTRFSTEQVSRMQLITLNHVKIQALNDRLEKEGVHSIRARRMTLQTKFASLWQLVRMRQDGTISPEENYYLMMQLRFLPFFDAIPGHLYEPIVDQMTTQTFVPGCHLFREGEEANSLFLILTGQVHLRSETKVALLADTMKSSPALLLAQDLFSQSRGHPFLFRSEKRIRSQTAVASLHEGSRAGDGGPSTTVAFIFPKEVLEMVSKHFRQQEAEQRWHIVRHFAQQQRLSVQVCSRHQDIFSVLVFPRSYLFVNAGGKPRFEEAHLYYVMEGELSVVFPARKDQLGRRRGKARMETVTKGYLIGEQALYGEAYPCAVVSTSEVKVLVLKASAYLHQLLNRSSLLTRPETYVPLEGPGQQEQALQRGRAKLVKETTSFTARTMRLKKDRAHVKDREWKAVSLRAEMPSKVAPFNHQKLLSAAKKGRQAVEEDLEIDKVGRPPVCDAGRSGDGYLTRSLNEKLRHTSRSLEELEAAHRSHTTFHYHVEEICGSPLPRAKVMSVSPGSRMLMACGSLRSPSGTRSMEMEASCD